jgi:hypothetical protein
MGCKPRVRGHGGIAMPCDAAGGATLEVCGIQLIRTEHLPAVAVPWPSLFPHSALGLDVRVERDQTVRSITRSSRARSFIADREVGVGQTLLQPALLREDIFARRLLWPAG